MLSELKPYAEYKESGVPWLGRVPTGWSVKRVKALLGERSSKGFPTEPLLAATQSAGVVRKQDYESRTVTAQKDLHLLKLVEVGDFVISLRSFQGGIERAHHRGIISPAYTVLYPRDWTDRDYLSLLFKSRGFIDGLTLCVTGIREGQNIDYQRLSRDRLPSPQKNEQEPIVKFLGHARARIDRSIAAKRKMTNLLNEKMQVEIDRLVCGGIDSESRLRYSGSSWIGWIPEHWDILRAKYLFREVDERSSTGLEEQLSISHLTGVSPRRSKSITMFRASSYIGHKRCAPDDLVVNTMWAWMGALGVATVEGIVSPAYAVYRPLRKESLAASYADLLLRTPRYTANFRARSIGIRPSRFRLYPDQFLVAQVLVPPIEEQELIVRSIQEGTLETGRAAEKCRREIELLREFRTRLTSDVVTGQLDVREAAAKLPDLDPADLTTAEIDDSDDLDAVAEEFLDEDTRE